MLIVYLLRHLLLLAPQFIPLLARIPHQSPLHAPFVEDPDTPQPSVFGTDRENVHIVIKSDILFTPVRSIDATANALTHIYFIV